MNSGQAQNEFLAGLTRLLSEVDRELGANAPEAYAGAGQGRVLEHQTRIRFFDQLASLLGWDLGAGGNMAEEARIRAETTTYMDYVGVTQSTRAPVVLWEVKAWERPFIARARGSNDTQTPMGFLVEGIRHYLNGGVKGESPVIHEWHEHIEQVAGYVRGLREQHGHALSRALLASGQWIVIFTAPVKTFVAGEVSEADIVILQKAEFVQNAVQIFSLLARQILVQEIPFPLRPSQLPAYVSIDRMRAAYKAVHVHYQGKGSSLFARKPQVYVYPAVVIERTDGVLLTAVMQDLEFELVVRGWMATGTGIAPRTISSSTRRMLKKLRIDCSLAARRNWAFS